MTYRTRTYYTAEQKAEMWDSWKRGESMSSIGRASNRESSSVYSQLSPTGKLADIPGKRRPFIIGMAMTTVLRKRKLVET